MTDGQRISSKLLEREEILSRVRRGKMTCLEADQWAADNGQTFTHKPDPARFDPMNEQCWTLPTVAAWIVERSFDAVREHWEQYRAECRVWRRWVQLSDEGDDELGFQLGAATSTNLFMAFGLHERPLNFEAGRELVFALGSGQLSATGIGPGNEFRTPILKDYWLIKETLLSGKQSHSINSIDNRLIDRIERKLNGKSVVVARCDVLTIWTPIRQVSEYILDNDNKPDVDLIPVFPLGFDAPDWNLEHVLAWVWFRNLRRLRNLELRSEERPTWYGRRYRSGLVDQTSENKLKNALMTEQLSGFRGNRRIETAEWRKKRLWEEKDLWFRRDQVIKLWPEEAESVSHMKDLNILNDKASESNETLTVTKATPNKRGPKPIFQDVIARMRKDLEENKYADFDRLEAEKSEVLAQIYGRSRGTIRKALDLLRHEREIETKNDK